MIVLSHHPHIRNKALTGRVAFSTTLAWLPLAAAAGLRWPLSFPLALGASAAVALAAALLSGRGKLYAAAAGWCLADAALLTLLMPAGTPWHVPALLMVMSSGARALFRNRGFTPPVNFTAVVLATSFLLTDPAALAFRYGGAAASRWVTSGNFYFLSGPGPLALTVLLIPLLMGRWFKWASLLSFLAGTAAAAAIAGRFSGQAFEPWQLELLLCVAMVSGIGLVADQRSSPLSRRGQAIAGALAGCVFALFALRGLGYQGMVIAPLCANLLTPLLDYLAGAPARPVIAED